jgi:hypothetical protein
MAEPNTGETHCNLLGATNPQNRHCERSEAIQGGKSGGMDCFVGFASSQ